MKQRILLLSHVMKPLLLSLFIIQLCVSETFAQDVLVELPQQKQAITQDGNAYLKNIKQVIQFSKSEMLLGDALREISEQTGLKLSYSRELVPLEKKVHTEPGEMTAEQALWMILDGTSLRFGISSSGQLFFFERQMETNENEMQVTITGTVVDAQTGEALPGVNVIAQRPDGDAGSPIGTTTNMDGYYELSVPDNVNALVFTYIGYQRLEVLIDGRTEINIQLNQDIQLLEDLIVVGYGTKKESTVINSVSNINSEKIQTTTNSSLAQKIQGKIPGLQIRQNSGQPGNFDTNINIRGYGGSPLYIIDGIPRSGSTEFQMLNSDDIESISVLKDASAAIYGVRAANGVIIVTTKKGTEGKSQFSYSGAFGVQSPTDIPAMSTATQWAQIRNDAAVLGSGNPFYSRDILQNYIDGVPGYENTNWYDATMKKRSMQSSHNLSATGGTERFQYHISGSNFVEQGLLQTNAINYERFSIRSNVVAQLTDQFEATVLLRGMLGKRETPVDDFFNIYKGTRNTLPIERPYANGNINYPAIVSSELNPVVLSDPNATGYNEHTNKTFQSSVNLKYNAPFLEGLAFQGILGYDYDTYFNKILNKSFNLYTYDTETEEYSPHLQRKGTEAIYNYDSSFERFTLQGQVDYEVSINENHNLSALFVYEQQQTWARWTRAKRYYDFYTNDQINFAGLDNQETGGLEDETARMSYIGRINYDYNEKYLFEFAFRQDGSFRYHPDHRWGFFPVGTIGWRISDEFFLNEIDWLTDLKLRASYGIVGEDAGQPFQYIAGFSTTGGGGYEFINGEYTVGASSPSIVNNSLSWFTSDILNVGFDMSVWEGRFQLEFDLYQRNREGLLAHRDASLPNTFGGELPQENLNSDQVRGIDVALSFMNSSGDFQYGFDANFNYARTKNIYVERGPFLNSMDRWRNGRAERYNDIVWGYNYSGQFQDAEEIIYAPVQNGDLGNTRELPGDFRFEDVNNDGVIDGNDMQPTFWNGTPKMFYGLTLRSAWKGFDMNILFQGAARYSVRFQELYAEVLAYKGLNTPAYFFDRWRKADPYDMNSEWIPGEWPASRLNTDVGMMYAESKIWRRDASYVRLKSMELGYSFQPHLLQIIGLDRLRIYANAHNVFTITDPFVKIFDPEKIEGNHSAGFNYPLQRSFNFGININF